MHVATTKPEETMWHGTQGQADSRGQETILFVEDEAFVRDVTCEVLRSAGYTVLTARNAAEALTEYCSHRGDVSLLLTDVILPGETGRALAARLKREKPELSILFVTGYMEQMMDSGLEGADFLSKPFCAASLVAKVREVLDRATGSSKQSAAVRHAGRSA